MTDADLLAGYITIWKRSIEDFVALVRSLTPEQGALPTDLPGWNVWANVAHTAHLEAVLAGAPEETIEVPPAAHITGPMGVYTEQGIIARRGRSLAALADEIEDASARRHAALQADPPTDATAMALLTPGGVPWDNQTLLRNRPLDVWMHEQDIRRAIGRPGGFDSPAAGHVVDVLGAGLAMVVGKRVAPAAGTSVRVKVPDMGRVWTLLVGDDGRAVSTDISGEPTCTIAVTPEEFIILTGGRRPVAATSPRISGDRDLAAAVLAAMGVTP